MSDGIFNNGIQQPVQLQNVNGPFDWLRYKAEVAKELIRPCYEEAKAAARTGGIRSAQDVAIEDAINMAVDMAERLEKRLKGGGK